MAKRRPANKGKKCTVWGRSNGKKVCRKFGGTKKAKGASKGRCVKRAKTGTRRCLKRAA
jgi:hypothetical protein